MEGFMILLIVACTLLGCIFIKLDEIWWTLRKIAEALAKMGGKA